MDCQPKIRLEWVPEAYKEQPVPAVGAAPGNPSVYSNPFVKKLVKKSLKAKKR